ncbi:DUF6630 family protein [Vannielia litorea]|uniref:DUF6630 domain-containing protein n=1 Tax=Vannielia litorea TaxID=1217970 RepID=A0A1N6FP19_9RHOB|nr:hypothetical protein [Vannielia litorea]SIN96960.1 hypothetical protein SAMN05444002_1829 [Vannielia litorea]
MSDVTPGEAARAALVALTLGVLPLLPLAGYAWAQGVFDPPRIKLTRLVTGNDSTALRVARAIETGDTPGVIEAQTGVAIEDGGSRSGTLAWYLVDAFSQDSPRAAYFDWKDGCEQACPQLDAMLQHHGIAERPDPARIIADEAIHAQNRGAMPVVWAHYAPIFDAHGLHLLTLDPQPGWDAYYLFVAPRRTARKWSGTVIEEPGNGGLEIHAIPAPTSDISTAEGLAAALSEVTAGADAAHPAPLLAGLPLSDLF